VPEFTAGKEGNVAPQSRFRGTSPINHDPAAPQPHRDRKNCENSNLLPIGINFTAFGELTVALRR
jgi:hypothetical protein